MVDISFIAHYQGVLYPIKWQEQDPSKLHGKINESPETLVELCCKNIVQDSSTTHRAIQEVPRELCSVLMRAALHLAKDRSIEVLLSRWPYASLSLAQLAPALFCSCKALYDTRSYLFDRMRHGIKDTTCLAHIFVECLKKRSPTKLKYLDLSGYPTAEVIVNYLASHALLSYNEWKQKEILTHYAELTDISNDYEVDATLPDDKFAVSLNATIHTESTLRELYHALSICGKPGCQLKLVIHTLDISSLGLAQVAVLLEKVDPQYLTGLALQYNALSGQGVVVLSTYMKVFKSLTALDLSCNNIRLSSDDFACNALSEVFSELKSLKRVNLSNNHLKHRLGWILKHLSQPLEYLKVSACCLSTADIISLSQSHHVHGLQELDVSENMLTPACMGAFVQLLKSASVNLRTLEMAHCNLSENSLEKILSILECMTALQYLNIDSCTAVYTGEFILKHMKDLLSMPSLEALQLSYPQLHDEDMMDLDIYDESYNMGKEAFKASLYTVLYSLSEKMRRKPPNLILAE